MGHLWLLSLWLPETVGGAISTCSVRPDVSMHQDALLWGPPMTPGSLAAGGFPAGSLIIVPMLLSACSEVADPIGAWAVDSLCRGGQVMGRRAVGADPSVWGTCREG